LKPKSVRSVEHYYCAKYPVIVIRSFRLSCQHTHTHVYIMTKSSQYRRRCTTSSAPKTGRLALITEPRVSVAGTTFNGHSRSLEVTRFDTVQYGTLNIHRIHRSHQCFVTDCMSKLRLSPYNAYYLHDV